MDINQVLQTVMTFINEHTLILIGVCVFLILVLIGYLIDNSVKSKRIRNDIKNADQVPENIKDEIIKEAKELEVKGETKKEEGTPELIQTEPTNDMMPDLSKDTLANDEANKTDLNLSSEMDAPLQLDSQNENSELTQTGEISLDLGDMPIVSDNLTAPLNIDMAMDVPSSNSDLIPQDIITDETPKSEEQQDPDMLIMGNVGETPSEYKNDKKLSEILSSVNKKEPILELTSDIFSTNESEISINNEVSKNDVQIENGDDSNDQELDKIMRKLSSMNNNTEEDNYTNIF